MKRLARKTLPSFEEFESEILKDGALSRRNKLLIAVAVNCEFCVQELSRKALNEGVKLEELVEAASVACLICGGSAFRRASLILNLVVDKSGDKG
ncbi:MAG: carboxymuconolactone decarboxylase family protein [Candidatus Bathyarchaeia archaeon]